MQTVTTTDPTTTASHHPVRPSVLGVPFPALEAFAQAIEEALTRQHGQVIPEPLLESLEALRVHGEQVTSWAGFLAGSLSRGGVEGVEASLGAPLVLE